MNKKYIIILILGIVLLIIGITQYDSLDNTNQLKVGNTAFALPDGFYEGTSTIYGNKNITNGTYSIFIVELNETNIDDCIKPYKTYMKNDRNMTIDIINYTIDEIPVFEAKNTSHFWFIKNQKVYSIYSYADNNNLHNLVYNLIESTK